MKNVILITKNSNKVMEYRRIFKLHAINVIHQSLKDESLKNENTIATLWDESNIYECDTHNIALKPKECQKVYNQTTLYYTMEDSIIKKSNSNDNIPINKITSKKYNGIIDLSRKKDENTFGWDNIFVIPELNKSLDELRKLGVKNSGRDEVLSLFIQEQLYMKKRVDLNFNPQKQSTTVEFKNQINFIRNNEYLNMDINVQFKNVYNKALENGIFFRSSKNRRENNYWLPGLNAGMPLVPKKDDIHEITFAVHDISHFVMPDLCYTGQTSNLDKKVYIFYRMMSEAMTIVIADMLFIDNLVKSNIDYDFTKRKIYPLYNELKKNDASLKDILYANIAYCLKGDDSYYLKLLNGNKSILEDYKGKYGRFFIEDYKWTNKNIETMINNSNIFKNWGNDFHGIFDKNNILTIDSIKRELSLSSLTNPSNDEIIDKLFQFNFNIYNNLLNSNENEVKDNDIYISNAFKRYMIGQSLIFYKFDFLNITSMFKDKILKLLDTEVLNDDDMENARRIYKSYLSILKDRMLINEDDYATYNEIYPIFDSFFVFYDKKKVEYSSLTEIYNNLF
jgi:inosine/xanthosine triphosphate pyrophosphatase family protein